MTEIQPSFSLVSQGVNCIPSTFVNDDEAEQILAEIEDGETSEEDDSKDDWIPLDESLLSEALNGGLERSKGVNAWARRKFDSWRKDFKYDCSIPIEKLDLQVLNDMLARFILQVKKKKSDKLYPPATLHSLYRGIGRIVRREQEKRIGETGVREHPFDILHDAVFSQSREALICMVKKTRISGAYDRPKKKAPPISFYEEREILSDIDHQITHAAGCIKRLVYYILTRFGIRAVKELHAVKDCDLVLETDEEGELVKYGERISKNHQPTATKVDDRHFRKPIWTREADFILTYKQYVRHLPAKERDSEPRSLFLQPIPKSRGMVWYAVTPVGRNKLSGWLKTMASVLSPETEICNKSGRVSLVTRLAAADVPAEVGMSITGHKSVPSYEQYDRTQKSKVDTCMGIIGQPLSSIGTSRMYKDALSDEIAKKRLLGESSSSVLAETCTNVIKVPSTLLPISEIDGKENQGLAKKASNKDSIAIIAAPTIDSRILANPPPKFDSDEDYDDSFYDEMSRNFPDMARALGRYNGPVINNQGGFTNCTFNFGNQLDVNQLASVIASAMTKNPQA